MQLVLRINKTSIRKNNWVIFFHFEMIGIEFALKISQMCGIWSTLNIYGKIFTWNINTLHKLVHWFPTSKIYTMLFLNLDGLGRYNYIILTYVCYNFAIARFIPIFKLEYFWHANTYTGEILIWCHIDGVLSEKPQNTHNLNCLFFNGCLGWKFKNCWNDCVNERLCVSLTVHCLSFRGVCQTTASYHFPFLHVRFVLDS